MTDIGVNDCLDQKLSILGSLVDMASEKHLKDVRVVDICEVCGISRSTFYRYFSGVQDIPAWYQRYSAEGYLHQIGRSFTIREGHMASIGLLYAAKPLFTSFFGWWEPNFSVSSVNNHIGAMVTVLAEHGTELDEKTRLEVEGVAFSCHHLVARWFSRDCPVTVDELVTIIESFYPAHLKRVFDKPFGIDTTPARFVNAARFR